MKGGGETSSTGDPLVAAPKIDLLAGNNDESLQPILLGTRTVKALEEYNDDIVETIAASLKTLGEIQSEFYGIIAESIGSVFPPVGAAVNQVVSTIDSGVVQPMGQVRTNASLWKQNYLVASGDTYICSSNVRST